MASSHFGTSLRVRHSLLTSHGWRPLRVEGHDPVRTHHADREQVFARIFDALGVGPQRVAASAVHIEYERAPPATSTTAPTCVRSLMTFELLPEDERS
jgi:hypothetical protein